MQPQESGFESGGLSIRLSFHFYGYTSAVQDIDIDIIYRGDDGESIQGALCAAVLTAKTCCGYLWLTICTACCQKREREPVKDSVAAQQGARKVGTSNNRRW